MTFQTFKLTTLFLVTIGLFDPPFKKQDGNRFALTIEIEGVIINKGTLNMALYISEETFMKKPYASKKFTAGEFPSKLVFEDLPEGQYAVTIYQDLNGNKQLDKFLSIPTEPYGVSNNVSKYPTFENTKFKLSQNEQITIKIKN